MCCKVLECAIVSQLVDYLESNVLLSVHKLGFRKGRNVEDQLLVTYSDVVELVDMGFVVDMFFLFFFLMLLMLNVQVLASVVATSLSFSIAICKMLKKRIGIVNNFGIDRGGNRK